MSDTTNREKRQALLTWLNTLSGDALARAVIANAVWGDSAAYRALAGNLDTDSILGTAAEAQLRAPGPPMSERPKSSKMKGTPFEYDVFDATLILAKYQAREGEGGGNG